MPTRREGRKTKLLSTIIQRTPEQIRNHFEVERELATRLRKSDRAERTLLFAKLYNELFERVPDHPRLTRRETPEESARGVASQLRLLRPHLRKDGTLLEFAPGDCRLSYAAAPHVGKVIAADISDQRSPDDVTPENFELIVYDGYHLDVAKNSIDVAFSYQFLEHLHPEDIPLHFAMVTKILKPGGIYIFDTPHRFSGPHDVSRFFGDELQCFHFQEWTYREMRGLLKQNGFDGIYAYRRARVWKGKVANALLAATESAVGILPRRLRRKLSDRLFRAVTMMGVSGETKG